MSSLLLKEAQLQKVLRKFNEDLGSYINADQRSKLGKVLTIIDASIADPVQRKAIKDLVQNGWWTDVMPTASDQMANPHTDLRAICELFGFELYDDNDLAPPQDADHLKNWTIGRYKKVALAEE